MQGYMYILECSDGSYYVGSTNNIELRLQQHQNGEGANHTKKRLPVKLVYHEEFQRIDEAFYREKQVQGWSRRKKEALIKGEFDKLPELSKNYTQFLNNVPSTGSGTSISVVDSNNSSSVASTGSGTSISVVDSNNSSSVAEPVEATLTPLFNDYKHEQK